jgi:protein required for attachment to host cells
MRWTVVANTVIARIYTNNPSNHRLTLVTELHHPQGSEKIQDLVTDHPGHYQTNHKARGSYEAENIKEHENDKFAKKIVSLLENARAINQLQSLTLIASAHFMGVIEKHFSKPLLNLIDKKIQKNLVNIVEQELTKIIAHEDHKTT